MIIIEQLSKAYGFRQVLSDIDVRFEPGRVYGIVGENGSGKTTLFKCMTGIEQYTGTITAGLSPLKDHTGYLQTEPAYFSKITGREYIRLLCQARGKDPGDIDGKNIFDLPLGRYAATYSTGMKKKLALMAILLQENQYFILDEPFNGVDIQSNIIITAIIRQLKQLGKTLIISSHIFSTLSDICDEIHLLQGGQFIKRVYEDGFDELEQEMKALFIGNRIAALELK